MTSKQSTAADTAPDRTDEDTDVAADFATDDEPLSLDAYLEQRRDLDAQLVVLEARWRTRDRFPRWLYHASEAPRIVGSPAEGETLGAGWEVRPVEPVTP